MSDLVLLMSLTVELGGPGTDPLRIALDVQPYDDVQVLLTASEGDAEVATKLSAGPRVGPAASWSLLEDSVVSAGAAWVKTIVPMSRYLCWELTSTARAQLHLVSLGRSLRQRGRTGHSDEKGQSPCPIPSA